MPKKIDNKHSPPRIWARDGKTTTPMEDLFRVHDKTKAIPEISPVLLIDSTVLHVKIIFNKDKHWRPPGYYISINGWYSEAPTSFCHQPVEGDALHARLVSEEWDGVVLFRSRAWKNSGKNSDIFVMLVE